MKNRNMLVILCIALFMFFSPVISAASVTYELEELGMSIDIPDDYYTFTRDDMDEGDLSSLGLTESDMMVLFEQNHIYLNAIPEDVSHEIVVTMTENLVENISDYTDEDIDSLILAVEQIYSNSGIELLKTEVCNNSQIKFIKAYIKQNHNGIVVHGLQYYTIVSHKAINITIHSFSGKGITASEEAILQSIVNSVVFDSTSQSSTTQQNSSTIPAAQQSSCSQTSNPYIGRMIGILLWSLIPGAIAKYKGRSFWGYYFLCFLITPLICIIITVCLKNKNKKAKQIDNAQISFSAPSAQDSLSTMQENTIETQENAIEISNADTLKKQLETDTDDIEVSEEPFHAAADESNIELLGSSDTCIESKEDNQPQFCHKCGNKLYKDSLFCSKCGCAVPQ